MPIGGCSTGAKLLVWNIQNSASHSEPAAASATAQMAAATRLPSHTARPIIKLSEANAVNHVRPTSASQPLIDVTSAISAALKCQR